MRRKNEEKERKRDNRRRIRAERNNEERKGVGRYCQCYLLPDAGNPVLSDVGMSYVSKKEKEGKDGGEREAI